MDLLREELKNMLMENIPDTDGREIWIWGAGDTAVLYQQGLYRLEKEGFCIEGYIDSDPLKQGKRLSGKLICEPDILKQKNENICVLICSIQDNVRKEIKNFLDKIQVKNYYLDEVILKQHGKDVMACYDLLSDIKSKEVYKGVVEWRVTGRKTDYPLDYGQDYFALTRFSQPDKNEVFIDCGAFVGDTIIDYCKEKHGIFKKIICFEADDVTFEKLQKTASNLREEYHLSDDQIILNHCAVADQNGTVEFSRYDKNNGEGSKITDYNIDCGNCKMVCMDDYVNEPYSFLKADIESSEYRMLQGAEKGIKLYKPLLSICIYHNAIDLYTIPLLIKKIVPEYKFAVRHHAKDLTGTVVYAWV